MKLLINFVQKPEFLDFVIPELISLFEMQKINYEIDTDFDYYIKKSPVVYITFDKNYIEEIKLISSRVVLTKNFIKVNKNNFINFWFILKVQRLMK